MMLLLAALASAVGPTGPVCAGPVEVAGLDAPRPEFSGPVETRDVGDAFRLHFTKDGEDAVNIELVDWAAAEWTGLRGELADSAWRPLVGDDGTGGSSAIDAYFVAIDANGYANAVTPVEGEDHASCFIRLDPDIHRLGEIVARSIVRHELAHCLQYRYSVDSDSWLYEAGATYEQYRPAPEETSLRLLTNALWAERITQPERAFDDLGDGLVRFEYAGFIWFKHLEEAGVTPQQVWEAVEVEPRWRAGLDRALSGELASEFLRHAWANQHACGRAGSVEAYAADQAGCTAPVEAPRTVVEGDTIEVPVLSPWSTASFEVPRPPGDDPQQLSLSCEAEEGVLGVLVDDGGENTFTRAEAEAVGAGPVPVGASALVVVGGFARGASSGTCALTWVAARVDPEPGGGCDSLGGWSLWAWALVLLMRRRGD